MERREFSPVALAGCADYSETACRAAIAEIAEKTPLLQNIAAGTKIAVKVNLITLMKPEKAGTTHPALLSALVEYLRACGAEVVIGDSPGGVFNKAYLERVYQMTPIQPTRKKAVPKTPVSTSGIAAPPKRAAITWRGRGKAKVMMPSPSAAPSNRTAIGIHATTDADEGLTTSAEQCGFSGSIRQVADAPGAYRSSSGNRSLTR